MKGLRRIFLCLLLLTAALLLPLRAEAAGGKLIALTFDDGPGKPTEGLLDGLSERGIPATFFMLGECAERYPATVARAYREGHQIANHSFSHANMIYLTGREVSDEFGRTNGILTKGAGRSLDFLARVPYGNVNDTVRASVGMPIIGWSVDPRDWQYRNAETVRKNIVSAAFDGAIVLVHDIHPTSVDGALRAADDLTAQGYEFVTIRELFRRRGVELRNCVVYRSAPPSANGVPGDPGSLAPPALSESVKDGALTVTMSAAAGARIYCTLDGSDPLLFGWEYKEPFSAWAGLTVRAVAAYSLNGSRSGTLSVTLKNPRPAPPSLSVDGGRLILRASDNDPDPDAKLYYTVDGSSPGRDGIRYEGPVRLEPGTLLRACAVGAGREASEEAVGWYSPRGRFFRDVLPGDWFAEAVDAAAEAGWLQGTGNDCFSPSTPLYRGQLVTILHRMAGTPAPEPENLPAFPDVSESDYFAAAAQWAVSTGIADCGKDGSFSPGGGVTRETLAVMLARFLLLTDGEGGSEAVDPAAFKDTDTVSPSAKEAVALVSARGILVGDGAGYFHPQSLLTRAECATVLTRLLPRE